MFDRAVDTGEEDEQIEEQEEEEEDEETGKFYEPKCSPKRT